MSGSDTNNNRPWFAGISSLFARDSSNNTTSPSSIGQSSAYPLSDTPSTIRQPHVYGEPELGLATHLKRSRRFYRLLSSDVLDFNQLVTDSWHGIPSHLRAMAWSHLFGYLPSKQSISSNRRGQSLVRKRFEYVKSLHHEYYLSHHHTTQPYVFPIQKYIQRQQDKQARQQQRRLQQQGNIENGRPGDGINQQQQQQQQPPPPSPGGSGVVGSKQFTFQSSQHPMHQQQQVYQHHQPLTFESTLNFHDHLTLPTTTYMVEEQGPFGIAGGMSSGDVVGSGGLSGISGTNAPDGIALLHQQSHLHPQSQSSTATMILGDMLLNQGHPTSTSTSIDHQHGILSTSSPIVNRTMPASTVAGGASSSFPSNTHHQHVPLVAEGNSANGGQWQSSSHHHHQQQQPQQQQQLPGSPAERALLHQIRIDIPRTLPEEPLFQLPMLKGLFERVLFLWSVRHPASGYVQGMNDIVATLFLVCLEHILWSRLHFVNGIADVQHYYKTIIQQQPQQQRSSPSPYQLSPHGSQTHSHSQTHSADGSQPQNASNPMAPQLTMYPCHPPLGPVPRAFLEEILGGLPPEQHQPSPQSYCLSPKPVLTEDECITPPPTIFTWRNYLSKLAAIALNAPSSDDDEDDDSGADHYDHDTELEIVGCRSDDIMSRNPAPPRVNDTDQHPPEMINISDIYDEQQQHVFLHPHNIHQIGCIHAMDMFNSPQQQQQQQQQQQVPVGQSLIKLPALDPQTLSPGFTFPVSPTAAAVTQQQHVAIATITTLLDPRTVAMAEADTYWLFTHFMDHIQDNYIKQQPGLKRMTIKFTDLVQQADPHLHEFLSHMHSIKAIQYTFRWFNCLFLREFSAPHLLRSWDSVIASAVHSFDRGGGAHTGISTTHTPVHGDGDDYDDDDDDNGHARTISIAGVVINQRGGSRTANPTPPRAKIITMEDALVYFGVALLLFFRENLLLLDNFPDIITFIQQDIPHLTHTFSQDDVNMLLANMFIYQSTYTVSSSSLQTIAALSHGEAGGPTGL